MEVVSSCITCLGPILLDPLKREVRYIKDLKENVEQLVREMGELLTQEKDVNECVRRERLRLMNLLNQNEVDHWLENVKRLKEQVSGIETEFGEDKRCLTGCLPNYCSSRKLAIETQRLIREVEILSKKKPSVDVDVVQVPPATLVIPTESFKGVAAKMAFESILDYLKDKKIAKIGVYGMGGVGKTTIIKHIKNFLQQEHIFSEIVFVTVSQSFDLKTIQKVIAEQIGLKLDKDYSEDTLSIMLHEALQQRNGLLLILDDLWRKLSLKDIGISEPLAKCKVVLTTRSREVCQSMCTDKDIKVEFLSPKDAWSLFQENARTDDVHDPDVKDLAKQVAKECGGLPLAIVTVGRALTGENDVSVWRNALNQLKCSTTDIVEMEEKVFKRLKFSFYRLRTKNLQDCFLYCSLFPEDYSIKANVVIDHWIWDGLIDQMENKQAEVDHGRYLLNQLKQACMLEFDNGYDTVKMHDLMRDMAIGITRDNPRFMVKTRKGLDKAPAENEWLDDVERISLMYNRIEILSGQPRCPRLRTLLLNDNHSLSEIIPHSFFDNMCNLRVLDLSHTEIEMLPDSICNLEKLHVLLLNHCGKLKTMPSLANLKELRVLRLSDALVEEMPESLASLENLLELNLKSCENLKMLPSFAKLKNLRNLRIHTCTSIEELPGSLFELENLHDLSIKTIATKLKILPSFAKLKNLKKLDLRSTSTEELPESLFDLKNLEELYLIMCSELKTVHSFANLKKLKVLHVTNTYVEKFPESLFELEKLCELNLSSNKKLKMIPSLAKLRDLRKLDLSSSCIEELPESLSKLENLCELRLKGCKNLKRVPSLEKVDQLRVLQLDGAGIEELPEGMERLVTLEILNLSETRRLRRFPHGILPKLSHLQEFSTEGSSCLCSSINAARTMEGRIDYREITGSTGLTEASFDCDDLSNFFHLFKFLQVKNLSLTFLLNSSRPKSEDESSFLKSYWDMYDRGIVIRGHHDMICLSGLLLYFGLVELDDYYINSRDGMQFVLAGGQDNNTLLLPKVLKNSLESPQGTLAMLNGIEVIACPKLKNLFSLQLLQSLPSLRYIDVVNCETIEELITGDDINNTLLLPKVLKNSLESPQSSLAKLRIIRVIGCPKLKNLFSFQMLQSLRSLSNIHVVNCETIEELIAGDDIETGESTIVLPKSSLLTLINLPALKRISSKPLVYNSLWFISIRECPHLKKIPLCIDTLDPAFEGNIVGKKEWWDALEWHDPTKTKLLLQPYFKEDQEKEAAAAAE